MGQNDDAKWEDFARVFENFTIKTIAFSFLFVGFFEFFFAWQYTLIHSCTWEKKKSDFVLSKFRKIAFFGWVQNSNFLQKIIFKSLAFELKFSKIFNFFYHDITSWYIVVCLKRINWRLYWTNFGKQTYWDLVVFLDSNDVQCSGDGWQWSSKIWIGNLMK